MFLAPLAFNQTLEEDSRVNRLVRQKHMSILPSTHLDLLGGQRAAVERHL